MPELSSDVIALLRYLAPGFLVAWVYFGLTSHAKPSQFERVVQALIFTVVVQALVVCEKWLLLMLGDVVNFGQWNDDSTLIASLLTAILLGLLFATINNADTLHILARKFNLSTRSGYPSEWFAAFYTCTSHVVLQCKDGTRIFGWPLRWPSDKNGHFYIVNAMREVEGTQQDLAHLHGVLVDAADVTFVEFVKEHHINDQSSPTALATD